MKKIVQKFGGTSLDSAKKRKRVAEIIKKSREQNLRPVVVVSAIGRRGEPYATDSLIDFATGNDLKINNREKDLLMSCGEIISAVVLVQILKSMGIKGRALTGAQAGILTDNNFGAAQIKEVNPEYIEELLEQDILPVVAGFQGITTQGQITTLGRGGSDTTASILGSVLKAEYVEIFSDVKGVMTADPLKVNNARVLKYLSYKEICEMAYHGARVIHPRAAEIAKNNNLSLKVKSVFDEKSGTVIGANNSDRDSSNLCFHEQENYENQDHGVSQKDRLITAVTSRSDIFFVEINVEENRVLDIFTSLRKSEISADFINIRTDLVSFIVNSEHRSQLDKILSSSNWKYIIRNDVAKVSIVGGGITGQPGIMAQLASALNDAGIDIIQATDSSITISCLVKKCREKKALNVLHRAFKLE